LNSGRRTFIVVFILFVLQLGIAARHDFEF
jgi:hypothetical protein